MNCCTFSFCAGQDEPLLFAIMSFQYTFFSPAHSAFCLLTGAFGAVPVMHFLCILSSSVLWVQFPPCIFAVYSHHRCFQCSSCHAFSLYTPIIGALGAVLIMHFLCILSSLVLWVQFPSCIFAVYSHHRCFGCSSHHAFSLYTLITGALGAVPIMHFRCVLSSLVLWVQFPSCIFAVYSHHRCFGCSSRHDIFSVYSHQSEPLLTLLHGCNWSDWRLETVFFFLCCLKVPVSQEKTKQRRKENNNNRQSA